MNASSDVRLKDLRIRLRDKDYVPLMVGGMGVNISTAEMVLAIEKLGGIAHISDAMAMDLSDRLYGTQFTANKAKRYYGCQKNPDKSDNHFDLNDVREAFRKILTNRTTILTSMTCVKRPCVMWAML